MGIKSYIKENTFLKKLIYHLMMPNGDSKPRFWVRYLLTPLVHTFGKGSIVRSSARLDLLPNHRFVLGDQAIIEDFTVVNNCVGDVILEANTLVGIGSVVIGPVHLEKDVILAQHVVLSGLNHQYEHTEISIRYQPVHTKPIVVGQGTWIGANAVITAGIHIGKNCVIAGGSVVTKDIPDHCVAGGNPARILKQFDQTTKTWTKPQS